MNFKRIGRMAICLLMVCALLVNVSPIRAEASVLGGIISVEAAKVVGSALIGLGIGVGASVAAFDALSNSAIGQMISDGVPITDGKIDLYSLGDGKYGMKGSLVKSLFDWLYDAEVISSQPGIDVFTHDFTFGNNSHSISSDKPVSVVCAYATYDGNADAGNYFLYQRLLISTGTERVYFYFNSNRVSSSLRDSGLYVYSTNPYNGRTLTASGIPTVNIGHFSSKTDADAAMFLFDFDLASVKTDKDLTLGFVANPGISLATGYPEWHANSVTIPNAETGEDVVYYPIVIGGTLEETRNKTQEEVWTGEGSVVDSPPITEPDVGIDTEGLTQAGLDASLSLFGYELGAKLGAWFEEQFGLISALTVIVEGIYELIKPIADSFASIISGIGDILETLVAGIPAIIDAITAIPAAIADVITDALVWAFAPSEAFIQSKVEALISKYPTAETFSHLGHSFRSFFNGLGAQPPIIYIDLGVSEGDYNYGGRMAFIDLTWYARYKPTVDAILGAFIWLWAAWRFFVSIPGIISGAPGIFGSPNEKPDVEFHAPRFEVGKNWLNSGSSYHKKGDGGGL